jgi:hypothetical protein
VEAAGHPSSFPLVEVTMHRLSRFALVALIALLALSHVVTLRLPVRAGSGPAGENGDANGDGVLDLSDPIYLLRYLFQEGPAPVACADSPEVLARVDALEAEVASLTAAVQELQSPCEERPDRACTGLMWQKHHEDLNGDGAAGDNDSLTWDAAHDYCAALTLGGHEDWRLPSLGELEGLRSSRQPVEPWAPPGPPFEVWPNTFWTSTVHPIDPSQVWMVDFFDNSYLIRSTCCDRVGFVLAVRRPDAP